jgi:uncharacterized protein (DUF486 family)
MIASATAMMNAARDGGVSQFAIASPRSRVVIHGQSIESVELVIRFAPRRRQGYVIAAFAWCGHLKFKFVPLVTVILISSGIAFVEYCFAVPANRFGSAVYPPVELKTIQEVVTLVVFAGFTALYFDEPLRWMQGAGFALIALGAALVFYGQSYS